jgi:TrpR-related protein YerC/YecD
VDHFAAGGHRIEDVTHMIDESWRTPETEALIEAFLALDDPETAARFLRDLCTLGELQAMSQRWAVARLLDEGKHYAEISQLTGASTATITRIASWLNHGEGGYREALERYRRAERRSAPYPVGSEG